MRAVQRLLGVVVVLMLLLGSVGSVATAEQGTQTGTTTQTGGGKTAPTQPKPTPAPQPQPQPQPQPTQVPPPPSNNNGGGGTSTGTGSQTGTTSTTGSQGPNRPAPQPQQPPSNPGGGSGEFWILVDKSDHMLYALRGDTVLYSFVNNVGRPGWETPTGTFYINSKYTYDDMTLYSDLPDVPWVMYFTNQGHAIHGTYWTAVNGRDVSHGCVNLSISNAHTLFDITPIGTRVVIRY